MAQNVKSKSNTTSGSYTSPFAGARASGVGHIANNKLGGAAATPTPSPGSAPGGTVTGHGGSVNPGGFAGATATGIVPSKPAGPSIQDYLNDPTGGYGGYDYGGFFGSLGGINYADLDNNALGGYDSTFQAQLAALQAALSGQQADFTARRKDYDVDMNQALRSLGISGHIFDDPTTADVDESTPGQWMWRDLNTAAGRANYNLKNDYASRGVLQSSLFADALTNLQRSLSEQVESIGASRGSFLSDLARQQAAAEEENRNAVNNARAEALYRLASGIKI